MLRSSLSFVRRVLGFVAFAAAAVVPSAAFAVSPDVVISQVYGGGGNSGASYKNDFIELYNRGTTAVDLTGWSVQYTSATGVTWTTTNSPTVLSGTILPGHYYLIQQAAGAGGTTNLPTPDATGNIAIASGAGKVALVTNATVLTCGSSCATNAAVKDFVGFGSTANNFEGSGATPAPSNTTSVLRAGGGAIDTDNNAADFATGTPNPRNSATSVTVNGACGADNGQTLAAAAPANLCTAGAPTAVSGSGHPWAWSCTGSNGGTTASCSANIQSYGVTFTTDGNGTLSGATTQTIDYQGASSSVTASANSGYSFVNWTSTTGFSSTANPLVLSNVVAGQTLTAHFSAAVVNGSCGASNGQTLAATAPTALCTTGTPSAVSGSGHPWSWSCAGSNGGSTAPCSASIQTYTLTFATDGNGSLSGATSQTVDYGASASPVTANANSSFSFFNWTGTNGFVASTSNPLTVTNVTASQAITANFKGALTIFHTNDVHARLTPHKWVIAQHGSNPDVFEDVGGAAYLAGEMMALTAAKPLALVLDGGDISEGNPVGDMNCTTPPGGGTPTCSTTGYGNGGMTAFYELLHSKLKTVPGRGTRGMDALVVGNHDVRDASYITNMEHMASTGVPVISANVRDINCTSAHPRYPSCEHFPPTTTVTVNGIKVGIVGYTTSTAQVGASLSGTLQVVDCQWTGAAATGGTSACNMSTYVNDLRNNQHCDIVILLTHDGHSDLVDPATPVIADTAAAAVPEIAITGHWHTWAESVWQPAQLNYKTIFAESSSYMKYIGELNVTGTGKYISAVQHVLRNSDITPDPDVAAYVENLKTQYQATAGHAVDQVVGYSNDNLLLDNRMKWWSADEYPWSGNNTAGQWITDAMKWKCDQIWASSGGCDLAVEAGGGVRSDIPAGAVTFLHVYETFPWADDTYVRISMTGQDILNFLKATNLDAGFSAALDVTAVDGIPTTVLMNGQPINLTHVYKVAINNYMLAHPPAGYTWPTTVNAESDPAATLVRDSLIEFMQTQHSTPATAYSVGGERYHFNGEYSGGFRAVVTMMNDADSKPTFEDAFIRLLSANQETLARRGSRQVPTSLVNADGSVVASNRLSEQELYRSFLGFKTGALMPGDIVEVWGKASFYQGNPEFVDQEGVYGDGIEFKIVGHDASLAKPASMPSIAAFLNDNYKNHYVQFLAKKTGTSTVVDQNGVSLKVWDKTGYTAKTLPGNVGDTLLISGVPTMENFALRLRSDSAVVSTAALPAVSVLASHVDTLPPSASAPVILNAVASIATNAFALTPVADAQVSSGNPSTNYGTSTNLFVQSSSVSSFGNERAWLRFDLSSLPAGAIISSAQLQLWNWKSTGAGLPVEVRSVSSDTWTEAGITWNNQPALGAVLDTQVLATGTTNVLYSWNVKSFVDQEWAGDKTVSLMVKPVTENSTDATAPSYGFDAKEFGSNAPVLLVTTQSSGATVASVSYFYRYSTDNTNWGAWTQFGSPVSSAPYALNFSFPNGYGYYEFYSVATASTGVTESTPAFAQGAIHYQAPSGQAQTISFVSVGNLQVGQTVGLSATATSGLGVVFSSQTTGVCTVSGSSVITLATGNCILVADQAGDAGYWQPANSVTQNVTVSGQAQTITFPPIANQTLGVAPFAISASASSGLGVSFVSQSPSVCSITGNTVTLLSAGNCVLLASQVGNSSYAAAPNVSQTFAVTTSISANGDVPLPMWALGLLASGMVGVAHRSSGRRRRA